MNPVISVVIPLYNKVTIIKSSLESVLQQKTSVPFEIVIIDDGSTDNSAKIVLEIASQYSNVRYVKQDNAGPSAARNKGIELANGEWIVFLDADDLFLPNALQNLYNTATQESDISFACANFYTSLPNGKNHVHYPKIKSVASKNPLRLMAFERIFPCQGTYIFNKRRIPGFRFNTQYRRYEDYDNLLAFFRTSPKIGVSSEYVMCYRLDYSAASKRCDSTRDFVCHMDFSKKSFYEKILLGQLLRISAKDYAELKEQYKEEIIWCFLSYIIYLFNRLSAKVYRLFL